MDERTRRLVLGVLARHASTSDRPKTFELLGLEWDLLEGVFAPTLTPSTGFYSSWLPYRPGGTFLEVGCGAGVTAVLAVLRGCRTSTAVDVSDAAIENARLNAARHGVADRVRVLRSDQFSALEPDARFDLVFWNSNHAYAPPDFVYETPLQHAFFDAGYRSHRAYVSEGPSHLTDGGRLMLGYSSVGDRALLERLASDAGRRLVPVRSAWQTEPVRIEHQLLELAALR